jgi:hypothetical protein
MTTPLEKPVRRLLSIRRGLSNADHVVTMTARGIELREKGRRFTLTVPWSDILARAEHLSGEYRHRETLRSRALSRARSRFDR